MNNEIQFLKELQKQMQYEDKNDNDIQASPRFWVVGDYKWIRTSDDNAQRYSVHLPDAAEVYEVNEFIEDTKEDYDLSSEALDEILEIECEISALEWIQKYIDSGAYLIPEEKVHFIRQNTMFLTKAEAKQHIEGNKHHYTREAHTYAMTAWRAPTVGKLLNILMNFDWNSVERQYCDVDRIKK